VRYFAGQVVQKTTNAIGESLMIGATVVVSKGLGILADLATASSSADYIVIGRLEDTAAYRGVPGYEVVSNEGWTYSGNMEWVQQAINEGRAVRLASPMTEANIINLGNASGYSVFADEVSMFLRAGYTWEGDFLIPPH
jgi:hypothetical protein